MEKMKYALLRRDMFVQGITQNDISAVLGKSQTYLTTRFHGSKCFTIDEGYKILDVLKVPREKLAEYFPYSGYVQ